MPGHKIDRVTEDIRRDLSEIIGKLKDPRVTGLISITHVEVSSDLSYAKVYVSSIGGNLEEAVVGLTKASGYIRKELSGRLHIRKIPELKFIADRSIAESARISRILSDIAKEERK